MALILVSTYSTHEGGNHHSVEVEWEFESGLGGWANATAEEMDLEVYGRGGDLRANIRGNLPHLDSPVFLVNASGFKHNIVLRMNYRGPCTSGRVWVRMGAGIPRHTDYVNTPWDEGSYFSIDFDVEQGQPGTGGWRVITIPLHPHYQGNISQIRLFPVVGNDRHTPGVGQTVYISWIRIARNPDIRKVEGCSRGWRANSRSTSRLPNYPDGMPWHSTVVDKCVDATVVSVYDNRSKWLMWCNSGVGSKYFPTPALGSLYPSIDNEHYATTYNCLRAGGERITLFGSNFGVEGGVVYVDGRLCFDVVHTVPESEVECTLPPNDGGSYPPPPGSTVGGGTVDVTFVNGRMNGLTHTVPYLAYATPAPRLPAPNVSNVAAHSVDLNWWPPSDYWDAVTVTGYSIKLFRPPLALPFDGPHTPVDNSEHMSIITVGNFTTTTLVGLEASMEYTVSIAPMVEDQVFTEDWLHVDLYGRRQPVDGAVIGEYSEPFTFTTLHADLDFAIFTANSTLNHGSRHVLDTHGHLDIHEGEGSHGIHLVGDANIEGCNASHACCDGFADGTCGGLMCSAVDSHDVEYVDGDTVPDVVRSNLAPCDEWTEEEMCSRRIGTTAAAKRVANVSEFDHMPTAPCGPALRLTSSFARQSGAAWYPRRMQVREGFDTTFTFRMSNPSTVCRFMDDTYTKCRSRGSDGFAFVIQNQHELALGEIGREMGYGGIQNSIAIEFDTWYNPEHLDSYENHVSVQTRGWRRPNSANHSFSLGSSVQVPVLVDSDDVYDGTSKAKPYSRSMFGGGQDGVPASRDGTHIARIRYTPVFDEDALLNGRFTATGHTSLFLENGEFERGGLSDWGNGIGTLSIYIDDLTTPMMSIPLNLASTLHLHHGRAWVGFTASTGEKTWQVHDILKWSFSQLRIDPPYNRPTVLDAGTRGMSGPHQCYSDDEKCIHP